MLKVANPLRWLVAKLRLVLLCPLPLRERAVAAHQSKNG